jgi:hypothetical protein
MRALLRATAVLSTLALTQSAPATAGAPWISIEIPANPLNTETRGAFCLVRVYHHGNPAFYRLSGTAEGLVVGNRVSRTIELKETTIPGLWTVRYEPASEGAWVLVMRVGADAHAGGATVLVTVKDGQVIGATVPTRKDGGNEWPREVTPGEVDGLLKAQVASASGHGAATGLPLLGMLSLLPLGLAAARRR